MTQSSKKPAVVGLGTALAGGLLLSGSSFAVTPLAQAYMAGAQDAATGAATQAGSRSRDKAGAEGKGGISQVDADRDGKVSRAEFDAVHPGEVAMFAAMDSNGDGFVDEVEYRAHTGAAKAGMEGKCGEGKCGGMA